MDVTASSMLIIFLMSLHGCSGSFSFNSITEDNKVFCDASRGQRSGKTSLLWSYETNETVTVIEWYRQPGVLIARIFGVNTGAPFTVLPPYNATPYTVTQINTSEYNAGIKITGLSAADDGVYSVNVTASSPQSDILTRNIADPIPQGDKPDINRKTKTCTPPDTAVSVTTIWTRNGDTHTCTLHGGNAACSCGAIYAEYTEHCYYGLLAFMEYLVQFSFQLVILLVIKFKLEIDVDAICFIYHLVLVLPVFGWLSFIPDLRKKDKFDKKNLDYSVRDMVVINVSSTVGVVLILVVHFTPWGVTCEAGLKITICMLVAFVSCGIALLIMVLRFMYFFGCEKCDDFNFCCTCKRKKEDNAHDTANPEIPQNQCSNQVYGIDESKNGTTINT